MSSRCNYSHELTRRIEAKIPSEILEEMKKHGWNVYGIYELVKEELNAEAKIQKQARRNST